MKYELSMFLSPKMTDEEAEKRTKEIGKILERFEAKVLESNFLGIKDLAYPIKHFKQGYYFITKIEAESDKIKQIKHRVYEELNAIRLLITKQKKDVKLEVASDDKKEDKREEIVRKPVFEKKSIIKEAADKKEAEESKLDKELDKILEGEIVD